MADPIVDDMKGPTVPLELYFVTFQSHYHPRQGKDKQRRVGNQEPHIHPPPQASVGLRRQIESATLEWPATTHGVTMHDVLQDCESLREDRASVRHSLFFWSLLRVFNSFISLRTTSAKSSPP